MATVYLSRRATFCAAHRLHSSHLDDGENLRVFGKCNNPHGHGHNYALEVIVGGEIDPRTGMVMNLTDLKAAIEEEIVGRMDHKNLNLDVKEFASLNPTAENIAIVAWELLQKRLPKNMLKEIRLYETENNLVIYRGE